MCRRSPLIALYSQVAQSWRYLPDVCFKLIGLIPAISVIVWAQLASSEPLGSGVGAGLGLAICLLAVGLIESLRPYDRRNDELYDDTISRGRKIEEELGALPR